jgi:hypothetical protein
LPAQAAGRGPWDTWAVSSAPETGTSEPGFMLARVPAVPRCSHARVSSMARSKTTSYQVRRHVDRGVPCASISVCWLPSMSIANNPAPFAIVMGHDEFGFAVRQGVGCGENDRPGRCSGEVEESLWQNGRAGVSAWRSTPCGLIQSVTVKTDGWSGLHLQSRVGAGRGMSSAGTVP